MSIETLLEAAKFLELQAQQQQKTRGKLFIFLLCVVNICITLHKLPGGHVVKTWHAGRYVCQIFLSVFLLGLLSGSERACIPRE